MIIKYFVPDYRLHIKNDRLSIKLSHFMTSMVLFWQTAEASCAGRKGGSDLYRGCRNVRKE